MPDAALTHMIEANWGDFDAKLGRICMTNHVLIDQEDAARSLRLQQQDREGRDLCPYTVLYVDKEDNSIRSTENRSNVLGGVVTLRDDSLSDPMAALEVLQKGWVVVDSDGIPDEDKRAQAVTGLVDFLFAGFSTPSESLLLGVKDDIKKSPPGGSAADHSDARGAASTSTAGIAIGCKTKSDLFRAGISARSLQMRNLATSDSGILVQMEPSDEGAPAPPLAVLIPFDALLWKAASVFFSGDCQENTPGA